jgi:hypothetical protein
LVEFNFFYNIKRKIQNIANPKLLGFKIKINIKILKICWDNLFLLYSPFQISKNSQLRINVTWHGAYCQQHDEISKIKSIFYH